MKDSMRDDFSGPDFGTVLEATLENFQVDRANLEGEAVRQMELARQSGGEYVKALEAHQDAEYKHTTVLASLVEAKREEMGSKATETALKHAVQSDVRLVSAAQALRAADVRLEAAKLALKMFWERGETIRALLFSRNVEARAYGAPTGFNSTSPAPGEVTRRAQEKINKAKKGY
jgi:hypothetical protein